MFPCLPLNRKRRYRNGCNVPQVRFAAHWGGYSSAVSESADPCNQPPEFGQDPYTFTVAEDASRGDRVGTVTATDPDDDDLYYTIIGGNGDRKFGIAVSSGHLVLFDSLDYEATVSYTLTVQVKDLHETMEETDTATVEITVQDVPEELPPAPTDFSVSPWRTGPSPSLGVPSQAPTTTRSSTVWAARGAGGSARGRPRPPV